MEGGTNIRFDGQLPINTHGGNHSEAYIHGLTHVQEAVRLIRGNSTSQPPHKTINRVLSCSSTAQLSGAVIVRRDKRGMPRNHKEIRWPRKESRRPDRGR